MQYKNIKQKMGERIYFSQFNIFEILRRAYVQSKHIRDNSVNIYQLEQKDVFCNKTKTIFLMKYSPLAQIQSQAPAILVIHQLIIQNILIIYQMMSSSESQEALSDPLPRLYSCFCDKIFTTYPGIYLHLKSKHANLFQKYKKLKITKLFKKVKGENNTEIFKLDRLSNQDISNGTFYLKKNKLNNKKNNANSEENVVLLQDNSEEQRPNKKTNFTNTNNNTFDQRPSPMGFQNRYCPPKHRQFMQRMGSNPYYPPPIQSPFFGFPYYPPPQPFPSFAPFLDPPIKRTFQEFLDFSEANGVNNKLQLRNVLYNLMIFIDENYQAAADPRVKEGIILSYCDLFSPRFIGPLLNDYIAERIAKTQNEPFQSQVGYLRQFVYFLQERKLLRYEQQPRSDSKLDEKSNKNEQESLLMQKCELIQD